LYCAISNISGGHYYVGRVKTRPSNEAQNKHFGILLWRLSERLLSKAGCAIECYDECQEEASQFMSALLGGASVPIPKEDWIRDEETSTCNLCEALFTRTFRRHHCRYCGQIVCEQCSRSKVPPLNDVNGTTVYRICSSCITSRFWNEYW
jgi:hypothetical protein